MIKYIWSCVLLLCAGMVWGQVNNDSVKSNVQIQVTDTLLTFTIKVQNLGYEEIGIYENAPLNYCQLGEWPNCFLLEKKIGNFFYYLTTVGLSDPSFDFKVSTLKMGMSSEFVVKRFRNDPTFPLEAGEYLISFRITYIVGEEEKVLSIENIPYSIPAL